MLGAAITLPMVLVSGPLAGFLLGQYVLVNWWHVPASVIPIAIGLGFVASAVQTYRLIKKINEADSSK